MDKKQIEKKNGMRSLGLTVLLCVIAVTASADLEYGTHILGHVLFMVMIGILSIILIACEKAVFVLDAAALLAIVFLTSNGNLLFVLLGAVVVLSAILLAYAVRKKSTKTSAVLVVTFSVTIGYLLTMAGFYAAQGISLEISSLFSKLNALFDSVKVAFSGVIKQSLEAFPEEMLAYYAKHDITKEMLLEASLHAMEDYVDWVQLLLPGCFVFFVQVMGYIGVASFEKTARVARCKEIVPETYWNLYPTKISCVIYILVTMVYIIASFFAASSAFTVIITNFWIAFMPVMVACGFHSLYLRLKHPQLRRTTVFILVLLAAGLLFIPDAVMTFSVFMLTFMGAQDVFIARSVESDGPRFQEKN